MIRASYIDIGLSSHHLPSRLVRAHSARSTENQMQSRALLDRKILKSSSLIELGSAILNQPIPVETQRASAGRWK
jgi:hypothetical protein